MYSICFFFSSRRRHTRCSRDWSSDVCSSDLRDIADGAGARALWGTKGLANQVGEVGGAAVLAFGDLHEHTCYIEAHIFINASQILTNLDILLATFLTEILVSQRLSHFEREVRLVSIPCLRSSLINRVATSSLKQPSSMK